MMNNFFNDEAISFYFTKCILYIFKFLVLSRFQKIVTLKHVKQLKQFQNKKNKKPKNLQKTKTKQKKKKKKTLLPSAKKEVV